jgi:hypothetical protein
VMPANRALQTDGCNGRFISLLHSPLNATLDGISTWRNQ